MAKRHPKTDKMASTGIRRLKGEEYPFGEENRESAGFSDLFDGKAFDDGALQREAVRQADEKKRQRATGIQSYPPPQATLDLHGFTAEEAEDKTRRFIEDSCRRGIQTVRVITGKGLHSPGGKAVLPDVIEQRLGLLKEEGVIAAFGWDRKVKNRSGALLVYL